MLCLNFVSSSGQVLCFEPSGIVRAKVDQAAFHVDIIESQTNVLSKPTSRFTQEWQDQLNS